MELASCVDEHKQKTEEYYEAKLKEMQESYEKEKAELIRAFENPESFENKDTPAEPEGEDVKEPEVN